MTRPIIILNFKTYKESTGDNAVKLARICEEASQEHNADIRLAVQAADIYRVSQAVSLPVYAQHTDTCGPGANTGWTSLDTVRAAGATGVFVNHSEHALSDDELRATMGCISDMDTVVFAKDIPTLVEYAKDIRPTWFCIEPPELISSKDASISSARPELIQEAVAATAFPLLVGAGVKSYADMDVQEKLGSLGVILASGVILAEDQKTALVGLLIPPSP